MEVSLICSICSFVLVYLFSAFFLLFGCSKSTRATHFDLARVIWFILLCFVFVWFSLTWEKRGGGEVWEVDTVAIGWHVVSRWEGYEDPTIRSQRIAILLYVQNQANSAYAGYYKRQH